MNIQILCAALFNWLEQFVVLNDFESEVSTLYSVYRSCVQLHKLVGAVCGGYVPA